MELELTPAVRPTNEGRGGLAQPKRPLSAFNLFYRFKRQHVTHALARGAADREGVVALIEAAPGLERCPPSIAHYASPELTRDVRRYCIRKDLVKNMLSRESWDRSYRKDWDVINDIMGFVELARVMRASWKGCDEFAKGVFRELADEGRTLYRQRMKVWNDAMGQPLTEQPSAKQSSAKLTEKCSGDGKVPLGPTMQGSRSRASGESIHTAKQLPAKEGQPASKSKSAAFNGSNPRNGGVDDDMPRTESGSLPRTESGSLRERFRYKCDNAHGPSNSHDDDPRYLFFEQRRFSGRNGGPFNSSCGVPPNDLRYVSMNRSSFQGRFFKRDGVTVEWLSSC